LNFGSGFRLREHVIERSTIKQTAIDDHGIDSLCIVNVLNGTCPQQNQVGETTSLYG
jgi:hypothetical protein